MIAELLEAAAAAIAATPPAALIARRELARRARARYAKCLRSINGLERELFPEWFRAPAAVQQKVEVLQKVYGFEEIDFAPGARWEVDASDVRILRAVGFVGHVTAGHG